MGIRAGIENIVGVAREASKLDQLLLALGRAGAGAGAPSTFDHQKVFGAIGDYQWLLLNTIGRRRLPFLRKVLPGLPDPEIQRGFIGKSGDPALREAFTAYRMWKQLAARYGRPLGRDSSVLDFGCGWGRTIRFFMRDVARGNLWGADVMPLALELSRKTNPWGQFVQVSPLPPSELPSDEFDLIYLYSVFSHLSEEAHNRWLTEFSRILKPGGILIATTWPREYIEGCAQNRRQASVAAHEGAMLAFKETAEWNARYDRGEYCHSATGGGNTLDAAFYGETCIPEAYVRRKWADRFEVCTFLTEHPGIFQDVIVARKPARPH